VDVLVVGAGPVGFLYAWLWLQWGARVSLCQRSPEDQQAFEVVAASPKCKEFTGHFQLHWRGGLDALVPLEYEWIVLAVPAQAYGAVAEEILTSHPFLERSGWILPSASFAAHTQLRVGLKSISLSSFFGASKKLPEGGGSRFLLRALKKRIYAGGSGVPILQELLTICDVEVIDSGSALAAESRNITSYVHPPLFLTPFSLHCILRLQPSKKWMYKLYPEGPITRGVMESMLRLNSEIGGVLKALQIQPINLLSFLNDDNYAVLPESIEPKQIEDFPSLSFEEQAFLLYIRYASLLIDPLDNPDPDTGRYPEFSAVPFPCVDSNGMIPRVPLEDYRTLLVYLQIGQKLLLETPEMDRLCENFEFAVKGFELETSLTTQHCPRRARAFAAQTAVRVLGDE